MTPPGSQNSGSGCPPPIIGFLSLSQVDVKPIPVALGVRDYFFANDDGEFTFSIGNAATGILQSMGACNEANSNSTPMVVKIEIEGPAGEFLNGLANQQYTLQPQQQKSIRVEVADLLNQVTKATEDQFLSANIRIRAWQSTKPNEVLMDRTMRTPFIIDTPKRAANPTPVETFKFMPRT